MIIIGATYLDESVVSTTSNFARVHWVYALQSIAQSAGAIEYTDCTSAEG